MTYQQFTQQFPVRRSVNTGKWGFERYLDCLDLNRCVYRTKRAAELARERKWLDTIPERVRGT